MKPRSYEKDVRMTKTRFTTFATVLALSAMAAPAFSAAPLATAVFAGGCFWTVEHKMEAVPGVKEAVSGYAGGPVGHPTYENHNGYLEAVKVTYDPAKISYRKLADYYWRMIDPTDTQGQVCDLGPTYMTAIYVANPTERKTAEDSEKAIDDGKRFTHIATKILPLTTFYPAEAYHQGYAKKNPAAYEAYRVGCGRDKRLAVVWTDKPRLPGGQ
jgi:peptide-methionine (S)-S-oxide reductase